MPLLEPTLAPAPVMEDAPLEAVEPGDDDGVVNSGADAGCESLLRGGNVAGKEIKVRTGVAGGRC